MEVDERTEIDPAEYFNPERPLPNPGPIRKTFYPIGMGVVGVGMACFANFVRRRPMFSGKPFRLSFLVLLHFKPALAFNIKK